MDECLVDPNVHSFHFKKIWVTIKDILAYDIVQIL
jgi:hypothetical protein